MAAGAIRSTPVEPLAHILLGGLVEGAMLLAGSDDPDSARADVGEAIGLLIDGLSTAPQRRRNR
jgi:hypothetical protein